MTIHNQESTSDELLHYFGNLVLKMMHLYGHSLWKLTYAHSDSMSCVNYYWQLLINPSRPIASCNPSNQPLCQLKKINK